MFTERLLEEFDHEIATTRRVLARVPEGRGDWKPHPRSPSLDSLARHLAELPAYVHVVTERDDFDIAPPSAPASANASRPAPAAPGTDAFLAEFDAGARVGREALARAAESSYDDSWQVRRAGEVLATMPRYLGLRTTVLNHVVHHRAQLALYLRILGEKVPSMYGPSADEP